MRLSKPGSHTECGMRPNGFIKVSTTRHRRLYTKVLKRKSLTMKRKTVTYTSPLFVQNNGVHCDMVDSTFQSYSSETSPMWIQFCPSNGVHCALFPYFRNDLKELTLDMGIEALRNLCRLHLKISKQVVRLKNQLHAALNQSFGPVYKKFFNDLNATSMQFYVHCSQEGWLMYV